MNIQFLSAQPWTVRLGWTLVHFLWQGMFISVLYAASRAALRSASPNIRYRLGCTALAAMIVAPLLTWSVIGGTPPAPVSKSIPVLSSSAAPLGVSAPAVRARASSNEPGQYLSFIVMLWIAGAIGFGIRLIGSWMVAAGMRSTRVRPAPAEWESVLTKLACRIGVSSPVRLLVSAMVQVPTVVGSMRPVILMPIGALTGLPMEQVEALLLHELAHIRRHDYLMNIVQGIAEALLFYHPAVWWVSGHIRSERELCCDDIAVSITGDVFNYASALAELESFRRSRLSPAVAANGGSLSARISRLLVERPRPVSASSVPGVLTSAALGTVMVAGLILIAFSVLNASAQSPAAAQARAKLDQGKRAFNERRYEAAEEYLQGALQLDPTLIDAELYLAKAYSGQYFAAPRNQDKSFADKAIATYESVLTKDPRNVNALAGVAGIYQNTSQLQKAHDLYLKIEQMVPLDPVAFYSVGSIDWIIVFDKRAPRPADEKAAILEEGLQQLDIALALNAEYEDAMTYRNLLLREKAILAPDPATKQRLIAEADDWFNKALQLHRKHQESGQPSGPSSTVDLVPPPSPPPPPPPPRAGQNGTRSGSSAPGGVVSGDLSHEGQKIEDR